MADSKAKASTQPTFPKGCEMLNWHSLRTRWPLPPAESTVAEAELVTAILPDKKSQHGVEQHQLVGVKKDLWQATDITLHFPGPADGSFDLVLYKGHSRRPFM